MKYDEWLTKFEKGKEKVASFDQSDSYAVHSIQRYVDKSYCLWDIAITYTGRLVVRSGQIGSEGVTVKWENWTTLHDVQLPKSSL